MLALDLDGRDELGTPVKRQLVVEMLGRQSNVILVSGDGHIIDCMRRVDSSMSETRQVQPGLFYRTPPRQDKPVPFVYDAGAARAGALRPGHGGDGR